MGFDWLVLYFMLNFVISVVTKLVVLFMYNFMFSFCDMLHFLLCSKFYVTRKHWSQENCWLPVFNRFYTFCDVLKTILLFLEKSLRHNFVTALEHKLVEIARDFKILLHLSVKSCWVDFSTYRSRSSDVVRNF